MCVCFCGCHQPVCSSAAIVITPSMKLDPATGLSTTSSTLQYAATKEDIGIRPVFACVSTHVLANKTTELGPFPIHCEWNAAPPLGSISLLHLISFITHSIFIRHLQLFFYNKHAV